MQEGKIEQRGFETILRGAPRVPLPRNVAWAFGIGCRSLFEVYLRAHLKMI